MGRLEEQILRVRLIDKIRVVQVGGLRVRKQFGQPQLRSARADKRLYCRLVDVRPERQVVGVPRRTVLVPAARRGIQHSDAKEDV